MYVFLWICLFVCVGLPTRASASVDCPKPLVQVATNVSVKIKSDIGALSTASAQKFDASAEVVTRDLFQKYSDSGTVALAYSTISIFCQVIAGSSLSDAEKLDQLYRLEEWITRISGHSTPTNTYSKMTCSTDRQHVLKPINAVFDAWSTRDSAKYMAQWAPAAIQRSKYYVRERSEIVTRRNQDFQRYSNVSVIYFTPKILFADGAKARVSNRYSMRFTRNDGRIIDEADITESYILECSKDGDHWLIRENNDYALAAF